MSLARQAIFGVLWSSLGNYVGFAIGFAGQLVLVRCLAPDDFGVFALALSIFEILSILTAWCFSIGVIQMPEEPDLTDTAFWLSLVQGVILIVMAIAISVFLTWFYPQTKALPFVFMALGVSRGVSPLAAIYSAQLEKRLVYKGLSVIRIINSVISTTIAVVFAVSGFGVWSLVGKELSSVFLSLIGYRYISGWRFQWRFNRALAKRLVTFGNKMLLSRGLEAAFYRTDSFVIGMFGGVGILGFYSQARYLVDLANAAVAPATAVVALPVYARMQHDEDRLRETYRVGNYFLIRVMLPVCLIFTLFPGELISFLFGDKWIPAAAALQWLALYAVMVPVFENLKTLLYGIAWVGTTAWIRGLQIATAVPMIGLGFHFFSLRGSAMGFMVPILIGTLTMHIIGRRYTSESFIENSLSPVLAAMAAGACSFWLKTYWIHNQTQWAVLGLAISTVSLYATILFLTERRLLTGHLRMIFAGMKATPHSAVIGE